ncbi:hypothetical protein [Sphingomonas sp.]|uniref:hypothetical protein n=1 Tax=Sphingomonas sp. TaxID=28214 RepID=UPI0035BBA907
MPGSAILAQTPPAVLPPERLSWYGDPSAPNLSGVWTRADTAEVAGSSKEGWTSWPPPLKGRFATTWKQRVAEAKAGTRTDDPVVACVPAGVPRFITGMKGPLLIVQTPGRVAMTREYGPPRRVWLDGRALPTQDNLEQFFSGNSVGHYEGATLIVDTIGVKDEPIDATGVPHSDRVVIQERYRRIGDTTLQVDVNVRDSLALSKPMRTSVTYKAVTDPRWELQDLTCTPKTGFHPELFVQ